MPGRARHREGFTLIEMLVALSIFSIAALALVSLSSQNLRAAGRIEAAALGGVVAENRAVEALTAPRAPTLGTSAGTERAGDRTWLWTRQVSRTADPDILRIDIVVVDAERRPAAALTVFRSRA